MLCSAQSSRLDTFRSAPRRAVSTAGDKGRIAPVRAELLPPLPACGASGRGCRHVDKPHRLPLHRPAVAARCVTAAVDPRAWAAPKPSALHRFLPVTAWLPGYDYRRLLRFDAIAGATVWGLLVPEMIAYSGLAGLP